MNADQGVLMLRRIGSGSPWTGAGEPKIVCTPTGVGGAVVSSEQGSTEET